MRHAVCSGLRANRSLLGSSKAPLKRRRAKGHGVENQVEPANFHPQWSQLRSIRSKRANQEQMVLLLLLAAHDEAKSEKLTEKKYGNLLSHHPLQLVQQNAPAVRMNTKHHRQA